MRVMLTPCRFCSQFVQDVARRLCHPSGMFAVDHAMTALVLKRRYPSAPLGPLLFSVQAMELAWASLNLIGIERTIAEPRVRSVADIHLAYMPFSHSVLTATLAAVAGWWIVRRQTADGGFGLAIGLGIISHLVLDLLTHGRDIALAPRMPIMLGSGLYEGAPLAAFAIELLYGVFCWWFYVRGRFSAMRWRALLALAIVGNVLNLSLLSPQIAGPEEWLGGRGPLVVGVVFLQVVVTLTLLWLIAGRDDRGDHSYGARG
jgi:hypothetical protein